MTTDRELLAALQRALSDADVDTSELLERAWSDAKQEVETTLRRLFTQDLLRRCLDTLEGAGSTAPATARPGGAATVEPASSASASTPPSEGAATVEPPPSTSPSVPATDAPGRAGQLATSTYVFGVLGSDAALPEGVQLPALPGSGPLRFLEASGCKALVCDVEPAVFEVLEDPGPEALEVLATAAQAHDETLVHYAGTPVIPLRMGTAFADDDTTRAVLERNAEVFVTELDRLAGHAEWAVTVLGDDAHPPAEDRTRAGSGTAYLEQRKAALSRRDRRWEQEEQLADAIHEPLAGFAAAASRVESRPLESGDPPLLHAVYLVAESAFERFAAALERLRVERPEVVIELTGPWPPYHFTAFELDVGTDG